MGILPNKEKSNTSHSDPAVARLLKIIKWSLLLATISIITLPNFGISLFALLVTGAWADPFSIWHLMSIFYGTVPLAIAILFAGYFLTRYLSLRNRNISFIVGWAALVCGVSLAGLGYFQAYVQERDRQRTNQQTLENLQMIGQNANNWDAIAPIRSTTPN